MCLDDIRERKSIVIKMENYKVDNEKFRVGVIGVGVIGLTVSNYLLNRFPNVQVNLVGRKENYYIIDKKRKEIAKIEKNGRIILPSEERMSRLKAFKTIEGTKDGEMFLDSDIILICAKEGGISSKERKNEYLSNKPILEEIAKNLSSFKGDYLGVFTNPIESNCELIAQTIIKYNPKNEFIRNKIFGITLTDTIRFQEELNAELNKIKEYKEKEINLEEAVVLGLHDSEYMVPIYSLIKIGNKTFGSKDLNKYNELIRNRVNSAVKTDPTIIQFGNITTQTSKIPCQAGVDTIESLRKGESKIMSVYNGDCFMSLPAKSINKYDKDLEKEIKLIIPIEDLLNKISKTEKAKFWEAKTINIKRYHELGLINEFEANYKVKILRNKNLITEEKYINFLKNYLNKI